ncbi:unnamed protein product [Ectocarpus sp. 13 AM-2016]
MQPRSRRSGSRPYIATAATTAASPRLCQRRGERCRRRRGGRKRCLGTGGRAGQGRGLRSEEGSRRSKSSAGVLRWTASRLTSRTTPATLTGPCTSEALRAFRKRTLLRGWAGGGAVRAHRRTRARRPREVCKRGGRPSVRLGGERRSERRWRAGVTGKRKKTPPLVSPCLSRGGAPRPSPPRRTPPAACPT